MTLSEQAVAQTLRSRSVPILQTERLTLRAPRRADARIIAKLANDRRIAENTLRVPHPYGIGDAEQFIAAVNAGDGETCFVDDFSTARRSAPAVLFCGRTAPKSAIGSAWPIGAAASPPRRCAP